MPCVTTVLPFASVIVYSKGVGPPGVSGAEAGCPTGPTCLVVVVAVVCNNGLEAVVVRVSDCDALEPTSVALQSH